ncbi:uncharacterized protein K441DRAFT_92078 [Cenococcum geophilum 1.58]|uniref:uncharacterized protein n=1 Tax=Cenococcum geophilum 1.58 TaxID=794803 RepID=UPI00358F3F45|nr:hypothetical protein K441DRAFT_92078 [Cenococcum geophilum 1.58]
MSVRNRAGHCAASQPENIQYHTVASLPYLLAYYTNMASQPFWTWDEGRHEYYYWSESESCWIYQSGKHEYYYWSESESCWIYQSGKRLYPSNTQSASVLGAESLDVAVPRLSENFTGLNLDIL